MVFKKIITDAFEQIGESVKESAKSSVKQIGETLSPWDMIRNSFTEGDNKTSPGSPDKSKLKELTGPGGNSTALNLENLSQNYKKQDEQKLKAMQQRLFQMVLNEGNKSVQRKDQKIAEKKQVETQEAADQRRREEERRQRNSMSNAPEGKSGRGTALSGKKKRKATEPQPAETKPGGGKQ